MPTWTDERLRDLLEPQTPTRGQWIVMLGIPALVTLGTLFVLVLRWLGEL